LQQRWANLGPEISGLAASAANPDFRPRRQTGFAWERIFLSEFPYIWRWVVSRTIRLNLRGIGSQRDPIANCYKLLARFAALGNRASPRMIDARALSHAHGTFRWI
jgi:hypothetical protein